MPHAASWPLQPPVRQHVTFQPRPSVPVPAKSELPSFPVPAPSEVPASPAAGKGAGREGQWW
jgi:hypothetical protein